MTQFALLCISLSPHPPVSLPVSYRPPVISDDEARPGPGWRWWGSPRRWWWYSSRDESVTRVGQSGPAFTAFHHKLNVYTALLSRLRPLQIWASGWGYFAFKSHTDSNPRQRSLSPRLCRDFSPPLLGLNYFNTDLLSEDTVILDLLPDLITCVRSSLFPINHFE